MSCVRGVSTLIHKLVNASCVANGAFCIAAITWLWTAILHHVHVACISKQWWVSCVNKMSYKMLLLLLVSPLSLYLQGRNITADVLKHLLETRVTEHLEDCLQNPIFSVTSNVDGSPNLMISCKVATRFYSYRLIYFKVHNAHQGSESHALF